MSGGTSTTTSSTASSDPKVKSTLDQLLGGVSSAYTAGPTYQAPGATTTGSQAASLTAANNPAYASGVGSALGGVNSLIGSGGLTAGQQGNLSDTNNLASLYGQMANDPGSTQAGKNLINSVLGSTNSAFNNSGLFGSNNNQTAAAQGLTQGLGDLQNTYLQGQSGALSSAFNEGQQGTSNVGALAQLYPTLFNAAQLPSATGQTVGAAQDTAAQAGANKNITLLGQLSSILNGSAGTAGSTTTSTSPTQSPILSLLGIALGGL